MPLILEGKLDRGEKDAREGRGMISFGNGSRILKDFTDFTDEFLRRDWEYHPSDAPSTPSTIFPLPGFPQSACIPLLA